MISSPEPSSTDSYELDQNNEEKESRSDVENPSENPIENPSENPIEKPSENPSENPSVNPSDSESIDPLITSESKSIDPLVTSESESMDPLVASESESIDPLVTSESEMSTSSVETTGSPFGNGVLLRSSIYDNGNPFNATMQPARISLYHGTTYINDFAGKKLLTMKTTNRGTSILSGVLGAGLVHALSVYARNMGDVHKAVKASGGDFVTILKSDYEKSFKDFNTRQIIEQFQKKFEMFSNTKIALFLGGLGAVVYHVLFPEFSFEDISKLITITARRKASRDAFVIEYVDRKGMAPVPMIFLLKLNEETKTWDLFLERTGSGLSKDMEAMHVQDELNDDKRSPAVDAANTEKRNKNVDISMMSAGNAGMDNSDYDSDNSDTSTIDLSKPILETPPSPEKNIESTNNHMTPEALAEKSLREAAERNAPELSIPTKWRKGTKFGTPDGNYEFTVEKFARFSAALTDKYRISFPNIVGSLERHDIKFNGPTTVPRDVLVFASYIVRQMNTFPIEIVIYLALIYGNVYLLRLIGKIIEIVVQGSVITKRTIEMAATAAKKAYQKKPTAKDEAGKTKEGSPAGES
jgi:hypothetical protein